MLPTKPTESTFACILQLSIADTLSFKIKNLSFYTGLG